MLFQQEWQSDVIEEHGGRPGPKSEEGDQEIDWRGSVVWWALIGGPALAHVRSACYCAAASWPGPEGQARVTKPKKYFCMTSMPPLGSWQQHNILIPSGRFFAGQFVDRASPEWRWRFGTAWKTRVGIKDSQLSTRTSRH